MHKKPQSASLDDATAEWDGNNLTVRCGDFTRRLRLTDVGMATVLLRNGDTTWVETDPRETDCDWYIFELITPESRGELAGFTVKAIDNPRLNSPHVVATAELLYPDSEMKIRYRAQVYPDAPGVRTQLYVRALRPFKKHEIPSYLLQSYAESLALDPAESVREAIGYYNDPQHRNHDDTPIMRRENRSGELAGRNREVYDWANLLSLERNGSGLLFVKESHKCVNQPGIESGAFVLKPDRIQVTGLGLKGNNYGQTGTWMPHDRYRGAWANWCIPYRGGEGERQLALKRFDRARFQPDPENQVYSRSNTWGTRYPGDEARAAAEQDNVLKEIQSCADLCIDVVAIDDGWQFPPEGLDRAFDHDWRPNPDRFPNGWTTIREEAEKAGVELQLWLPGAQATLEQIIRNLEQGGFTGLKVDFLNFPTRDAMDAVVKKIERASGYVDYQLKISWDVTENAPRLGYYFGREFGSLHTSNRKPTYDRDRVHHIAYTPRLILRDAWHLAHYVNLNQIEIPVQDVDKIDPDIRNSSEYSHAYCAAISVVGLPLFFQETHLLKGNARKETRIVMKTWREHRDAMARGYVFPIGDEPCDGAWTGFQCHDPETQEGYVVVFRELKNGQSCATMPLYLTEENSVVWQDVMSGEEWQDQKGNGALACSVEDAPGFRWLQYRLE
ncbi:MAG: hypothetical protein ACLFWL_13600 [Candidatus Brocadiia bacterium]